MTQLVVKEVLSSARVFINTGTRLAVKALFKKLEEGANSFLKEKNLVVELFDKNFTWLDSGTHESMLEASNYIHTIEKRTGLKIACIEEIAYKLGYIDKKKFNEIIDYIGDNQYGDYLKKIKDGI